MQTNRRARPGEGQTFAALDLGTNNCRLLIARPTEDGFRIVEAYSNIVLFGEGLLADRPRCRSTPRVPGSSPPCR